MLQVELLLTNLMLETEFCLVVQFEKIGWTRQREGISEQVKKKECEVNSLEALEGMKEQR